MTIILYQLHPGLKSVYIKLCTLFKCISQYLMLKTRALKNSLAIKTKKNPTTQNTSKICCKTRKRRWYVECDNIFWRQWLEMVQHWFVVSRGNGHMLYKSGPTTKTCTRKHNEFSFSRLSTFLFSDALATPHKPMDATDNQWAKNRSVKTTVRHKGILARGDFT